MIFAIYWFFSPLDTYVKLTLLNSMGQEMSKCKTSIRRGQPNPVYKETFVFQVALFQLSDVTLILSVYNKRSMKRKEMIGWISLGLNSSGEEELSHWTEMKESKGQQVCRWHALLESWWLVPPGSTVGSYSTAVFTWSPLEEFVLWRVKSNILPNPLNWNQLLMWINGLGVVEFIWPAGKQYIIVVKLTVLQRFNNTLLIWSYFYASNFVGAYVILVIKLI